MTRLERYNKNIKDIEIKFNNNIEIVNDEYIHRKTKTQWLCNKHNTIFESTIAALLNKDNTCLCPVCKHEKLLEASLKGVQRRKELRDESKLKQ